NSRFPAFFIFIDTASRNIDVNIHPNKKEIKFVYEEALLELLTNNISKALYDNNSIRNIKKVEDQRDEINFYDDYENVISTYNKIVSETNFSNAYKNKEKEDVDKDFFLNFKNDKTSEEIIEEELNFIDNKYSKKIDDYKEGDVKTSNQYLGFENIIYKTSFFNRYSVYQK